NTLAAGVQSFQTTGAYYQTRLVTSFGLGIHYFNYGQNDQTDAAGNLIGRFHAADYVVQAMVSRSYLQRWHYWVTLKWLQSSYGIYRASALAMDAGVTYTDSLQGWRIGLVASNMGSILSNYATESTNGDLPFDLRIGLSRKLPKAPIQLSLTLHHLHRFNLTYDDTSSTRLQQSSKSLPETIFRHVVIGTQIFITDRIEFSAGYNYLRRKELNIANGANGLNGFSMGVGVLFKRLQFRYARTYYQSRNSIHQVGLSLQFSS
ncbi:MAG: PorV/PorQ family protein, partial [Chitinophagaceae bacterium]